MNDRIAILRQSIVAVTQALSSTDVLVTQAGLEAWVRADTTGKPVQVNLPYVPDNADESLIDAIQGFLDHEVAHILFTDFKVASSVRDKTLHSIMNILEDARIEKAMANKYRGCGTNLNNTSDFFLENMIEPEVKKALSKGASQEEMVGLLATPMLRALSGQTRHQEYMRDRVVHVQDFYDKIKDLAPEMEALSSTSEVMTMAQTIIKRIKDESPKPEEDEESGDGEDDEDSSSGGEDGEDGTDSSDEGEGGDKGDADKEKDGKDEEKGKEKKPLKSKKAKADSDISNINPAVALDAIDKESANDYDKALSRKMGEQVAHAAKSAPYLVYTQDHDKVETLNIGKGFRSEMVSDLTDKVDAMVGPMAKDLERAMIARSRAVWESGLRRGRLNPSALARLRTGDDRVFRTRHESTTNDVAVSLVVDASGSMSGSKIHTASAAAYALSSVLDRLKIANEVICFTTGGSPDMGIAKEQEKKYGVQYSRYESLYMPIVKGYQERIATETKRRFGWLPNASFLANNIDGECVDVAFRRLMQRKEKGKVMIVLSDGCPNAYGDGRVQSRHLKDTVKKIEKLGTKVIGIGIQSDAVRAYYSKSVIVNKVEDLPRGVITELRTILLNNK